MTDCNIRENDSDYRQDGGLIMLVVTRRENETIRVVGTAIGDITIMVVRIQAGAVRIGIEAPPNATILRGELVDRKEPDDGRDRP